MTGKRIDHRMVIRQRWNVARYAIENPSNCSWIVSRAVKEPTKTNLLSLRAGARRPLSLKIPPKLISSARETDTVDAFPGFRRDRVSADCCNFAVNRSRRPPFSYLRRATRRSPRRSRRTPRAPYITAQLSYFLPLSAPIPLLFR